MNQSKLRPRGGPLIQKKGATEDCAELERLGRASQRFRLLRGIGIKWRFPEKVLSENHTFVKYFKTVNGEKGI